MVDYLLRVSCFPLVSLPASTVQEGGEKHCRIYTGVCRQCCADNPREAVVAYLESGVRGSIINSRLESQGHWNYETDVCGRQQAVLNAPPPPVPAPLCSFLLLLFLFFLLLHLLMLLFLLHLLRPS